MAGRQEGVRADFLRCLDTTNKGVDRNTDRDQEGRGDDVHAGAVDMVSFACMTVDIHQKN